MTQTHITTMLAAFCSLSAGLATAQQKGRPLPLPVRSIEACQLRPSPLADDARWGGKIAEYTATVDLDGKLTDLKLIPGGENLLHFVQVEDFNSCLAKWRLGTRGTHIIRWSGGAGDGEWVIEITQNAASFTLRIPYR